MTIDEERQARILTTHVGSLPRPDVLSEMMATGKTAPATYAKTVRESVADVVRRQVDCGIDIIDDGEQSKSGFIAYIDDRLAGMEPRHDDPPQLDSREKQAFPEFYAQGHSGTRPPPMFCTGPGSLYRPASASDRHRKPQSRAQRRPRDGCVHAGGLAGADPSLSRQPLLQIRRRVPHRHRRGDARGIQGHHRGGLHRPDRRSASRHALHARAPYGRG